MSAISASRTKAETQFEKNLERVARNDPKYTIWSTESNEISKEQWTRLAEALRKSQFLTTFRYNIKYESYDGVPLRVILEGLVKCSSVTELDFTDAEIENVTEFEDISKLLEQNTKIVSLILTGNKPANGLKVLASALKVSETLTSLDLSNCNLNSVVMLCQGIKHTSSLKTLDLSFNPLGSKKVSDTNFYSVVLALHGNQSITEVDLSNCSLNDADADCFARKQFSTFLLKLDLSHNKFTGKGAEALGTALKVTGVSLTDLNLSDCLIEDIKGIAEGIQVNRSLQVLKLSNNPFGDEHHTLQRLIGKSTGKAWTNALSNNQTLTDLDVGNCGIKEDIVYISEGLAKNRSLRKLDLKGNEFYKEGNKKLLGALIGNTTLTTVGVRSHMEYFKEILAILDANKPQKSNKPTSATAKTKTEKKLTAKEKNGNEGEKRKEITKKKSETGSSSLKVSTTNTATTLEQQQKESEELEKTICDLMDASDARAKLDMNASNTAANGENHRTKKVEKKGDTTPSDEELEKRLQDLTGAPNASEKLNMNPANTATQRGNHRTQKVEKSGNKISLDDDELKELRALPKKHAELANKVNKLEINTAALKLLESNAARLQRLFEMDAKAADNDSERTYIENNPKLETYYAFFVRLLNGSWLACQSINSGLVANDESYTSDYVGQGLDEIGKRITGISFITGFFSGVIKGLNYRDKKIAVQRITMLFKDPETAFSGISKLSRQITIAKEEGISSISTPTGITSRIKEKAKDVKAFVLADDANNPLTRLAIEDCKKLLDLVKDDKISNKTTQKEIVKQVTGKEPKINLPASPTVVSSPSATSASTPSSKSQTPAFSETRVMMQETALQVAELQKRVSEKDAVLESLLKKDSEKDVLIRKLLEKLEEKDEDEDVAGGNVAQALIPKKKTRGAHKNAEDNSDATASQMAKFNHRINEIETNVQVNIARLLEHSDAIGALNATVSKIQTKQKK